MKERKNIVLRFPMIIAAVLIIAIGAVIYINQLDQAVSNNTISTIKELAEHDQRTIQNYIELTWESLECAEGRFKNFGCNTVEDVQKHINVECANSQFLHIYMMSADGRIYSDEFKEYDRNHVVMAGGADFLPVFQNGKEKVVARCKDKTHDIENGKDGILYGIRMHDFYINGTEMIALLGMTDIKGIQNNLAINSFYKDGKSRGYSAVIDMKGDYIVSISNADGSGSNKNFFDRVLEGKKTELTPSSIMESMEKNESFNFNYTNSSGIKKRVFLRPFKVDEISWYFIMSVEKSVFTEQTQKFLLMSMIMLAFVVVVVAVLLVCVMRSQRKEMVANADAKARSEFLANMSHEIRTPLNGVIGLIHLMEQDIIKDGEDMRKTVSERLSKAHSTANYLLSLINDVLDMSKLQADRVELNNAPMSADAVIDSIWSMQKDNIENRRISFIVEKDISVPWIIGDETRIKQVLMNIVGNAAKFTPEGGTITLSVNQKTESADTVVTTFVCTDTGCGMTEEFQKHIWRSFSQERNKIKNSIKGTGLGMAISKLLVEAMGGEITVKSKVGEGSTFTVTLHSEISEAPGHSDNSSSDAPAVGSGRLRKILVAEDNELNAEILAEILLNEGFEVDCAENGQIALDKFRDSAEGEIQVILMDMQMPVMDGCAAAAEIRKLNRSDAGTVVILACTANTFTEDRDRAAQSGMNGFIAKPIDVKTLLQKLETLK